MNPIVVITGAMRSGTSLVAAIVHHLGFHVAPTIPAPCPPSWRSDWEDPFLTRKLMLDQHVEWAGYFEYRRLVASKLGFRGVAVKSPYLALHMDSLERSVRGMILIKTKREFGREESLLNNPKLSLVNDAQIVAALDKIDEDICIRYEELLGDPDWHVSNLADALGVDDDRMISRAIALVGHPTEYAQCLQ